VIYTGWPGREAKHLPQSSAEVKNSWSYTFTHPIYLNGVVIIKLEICLQVMVLCSAQGQLYLALDLVCGLGIVETRNEYGISMAKPVGNVHL
jgi:hypothetical protein